MNCEGACSVETGRGVVDVWGDGDHVVDVYVTGAEVVVWDGDEGFFGIGERDGVGKASWWWDVVLVWGLGGFGIPRGASE